MWSHEPYLTMLSADRPYNEPNNVDCLQLCTTTLFSYPAEVSRMYICLFFLPYRQVSGYFYQVFSEGRDQAKS